MIWIALYIVVGILTGCWVAATQQQQRDRLYDALSVKSMALLAVVVWPLSLLWFGFAAIEKGVAARKERQQEALDEQRRQLAIGEAALNRDGFYGDEIKAQQLYRDRNGGGLHRHALTQEAL